MKLFKAAAIVCSAALAGMVCAPTVNADEWNKKTVIAVSGPVEIPGVQLAGGGVLPAGTYVSKTLDSQSDGHIVQTFSKDATIHVTVLAASNYCLKATDKAVTTVSERPAGEPEALRAWFYPGKNWGEDFVYPTAKTSNAPLLYTAVEMPLEGTEPIKSNASLVIELKRASIMAFKPTASLLPFFGLLGLILLGGAFSVRPVEVRVRP